MRIIPSIIAKEFSEIEEKIKQVEGACEWVQIDVCDGRFVSPVSWPYTSPDINDEVHRLNDLSDSVKIELHLMIERPEDTLDEWIDTPAKRIFIHHEAAQKENLDLTVLDMSTTQSGLALKLETPIEVVDDFIEHIDDVQLMSIAKIGSYGEAFAPEVLKKIKALRKKYPKVKINVDGGINESNIKQAKEAGANNVVVGSAIWKSNDPKLAYDNLLKIINRTF